MSAARVLAAVLCLAALAAGRAHAEEVERRGSAESVSGEVTDVGAGGITLRFSRNGLERSETIPWSEVRAVRGGSPKGLDEWLTAGEALWRGRSRVQRGDWGLAIAPLEVAAAAWLGQAPTPDGAAAALALAQAYARAGRLGDALPVAFEAMRQLRAGMPLPDWAAEGGGVVDATRGLAAGAPPMALEGPDAAHAAAALRSFDTKGDAGLAQLALATAALLEGSAAPAPAGGKLAEGDRQGLAFLEALRDSRSAAPETRAAARRALGGMRRALPSWADGWVRLAIGESLAMESDRASRERGAVLMVSVELSERARQPALAAAARRRAALAIEQLGDPQGAERLQPKTVPPPNTGTP
jgi:hypothetical protein